MSSMKISRVGLDYAGPVHQIQTCLEACYCQGVHLHSCLLFVTAVHLELTSDLLTLDAFVVSLRDSLFTAVNCHSLEVFTKQTLLELPERRRN